MSGVSSNVTALAEPGFFYVKDAPHYLYADKKVALLEDLKEYSLELPEDIDKITDAELVTEEGTTPVEVGYGSFYGKEYGGVYFTSSSSEFSVKLETQDELPIIDATAGLVISAERSKENPVRDITAINVTGTTEQFITIDSVSADNVDNCFGLNRGLVQDVFVRSNGLASKYGGSGNLQRQVNGYAVHRAGRGYGLLAIDPETQGVIHSQTYDM